MAISAPVVEVTNTTNQPVMKPQPPLAPKPPIRAHVASPQSPPSSRTKENSPSLLATLTQAENPQRNENSTTAIVRLPGKLGGNDESQASPPSVPAKTQAAQKPPISPKQPEIKREKAEEVPKLLAVQTSGNNSAQTSPLLSPTSPKALSPITSPPFAEEGRLSESPSTSSLQQLAQNGGNRGSSILKKSVSFNEVRQERQISDDERYSPDDHEHHQRAAATPSPKPEPDRLAPIVGSDDEEDDPDAVANHEAALALEDQAKGKRL